ncbi:MAG: hypothetical protein ACT4QD_13590 [Acidobacteriota bacterium]
MQMLSDDDLNLRDMTPDELDAAWDLWFDLAQSTNDADPPYTHGVFAGAEWPRRDSSGPLSHAEEQPVSGAPRRS